MDYSTKDIVRGDSSAARVPARTSVLLACVHALVRAGLHHLIDDAPDLRVAAEAEDAATTLERLKDTPCQVLILDTDMPWPGVQTSISQIRKAWPRLPVLMLARDSATTTAFETMQNGANGLVTLHCSEANLLHAVRHLASGGRYMEQRLLEAMVLDPPGGTAATVWASPLKARLSERQFEVMTRLVAGRRPRDIGEELGLSDKTVQVHKSNLMAKLGVHSLAELIQIAKVHPVQGSKQAA